MNKHLSAYFTLGLFLLCCATAQANYQAVNQQAFSKLSLEEIKQKHLGKRWLMVLWSLECPACFKELELIKTLKLEHPREALNIVFINADDTDDTDDANNERKQVINSYDMKSFVNFYFTDGQGDLNRYQIDPLWYGELPRSYFVNEQGEFHGKSGLLDKSLIKKWLIEK